MVRATATVVAAMFGLQCEIYMGTEDMQTLRR